MRTTPLPAGARPARPPRRVPARAWASRLAGGGEGASVWSERDSEPGHPAPASTFAAPGPQPPARGRGAGRDGRSAARGQPGRAGPGGSEQGAGPRAAAAALGPDEVPRAVPGRGAGWASRQRETGRPVQRRQRSPLRGRGPCASCPAPGEPLARGEREGGAEPRLSPLEGPGGGAAPTGLRCRGPSRRSLGRARAPRPPVPEAARRGAPPAEEDAEPQPVCRAALKNPLKKDEGACKCVAPPCLCL